MCKKVLSGKESNMNIFAITQSATKSLRAPFPQVMEAEIGNLVRVQGQMDKAKYRPVKKDPDFKRLDIGSKILLPTRKSRQSYLGFIPNQDPECVSIAQMGLHPSLANF